MAEEALPDVHDDALADVGHHIGGDVAADALQEIRAENQRSDALNAGSGDQDVIENLLDERRESDRACRVDNHRREGNDEPPFVRSGVAQQAQECVHSIGRGLP